MFTETKKYQCELEIGKDDWAAGTKEEEDKEDGKEETQKSRKVKARKEERRTKTVCRAEGMKREQVKKRCQEE